jgi:hypothetical protein
MVFNPTGASGPQDITGIKAIGNASFNYGTTGQCLISNGPNSSFTWGTPTGATGTTNNLQQVLDAGNSAGSTGINMNGQTITSSSGSVRLQPTASQGVKITSTSGTNQPTQYIELDPYDSLYSNSITLTATDGSTFINNIKLINNELSPYIQVEKDHGGALTSTVSLRYQNAASGSGSGYNWLYATDNYNNNSSGGFQPFRIQSNNSNQNNGSINLIVDPSGNLLLTGDELQEPTAPSTAQYLRIKLNGTPYKIALLPDP